jgi:DNA-binding NtrC family response regulator
MEKYKVLVIEDDETAREQLAKVIRKEGFEVVVAEDGRVGLEMFKNERPEIVITDLRMPGIDGLEVRRIVRRLSTNVPIILITAYGETDTAISALREGALDYLKKPLDLNLLILALGRAKERIFEYKKAPLFPNLLLADDEEMTRRRIARVLEKEGWKVFQASDGEEAINVFQQTKIDIVLLDIKMPKKDGLQTLHEMRNITDDFEAIILTGYGDESSAIQAMRDGAINFLKKPIDLDKMIVAVEKAIEKLTSDKALKYRIRELELAQEIIAKITAEKEIVVDIRSYTQKQAGDFAQKLLDTIPVGLVILDKDMKIRYINRHLAMAVEYQPEKINEEFVQRLDKMGIQEPSYESLMFTINKLFESPIGTLESISTGEYAHLTLTTITILSDEKKENVVLIAIPGEKI